MKRKTKDLSKSSINRIFIQFKNMKLSDISLILSAYQRQDIKTIKRISGSKSTKRSSILAIGRLASQYTELLNNSTDKETELIEQIDKNFVQYDYEHNLLLFGNTTKSHAGLPKIKEPKKQYYDFKKHFPISAYDSLLIVIDTIHEIILQHPNQKYRIIARYFKVDSFTLHEHQTIQDIIRNLNKNTLDAVEKYISTFITDSKDVIFSYLNNLPMLLEDFEAYDDYSNFELIEIILYVYKPFQLVML